MSRLPDWEPRLLEWLAACEDRPFAWGQHDCCTFTGGAIAAQTGVDFYDQFGFPGAYSTERGAQRALKRRGFADLFGPFDTALGARQAPLLLQRGDIVTDGTNVGLLWYRAGPCGLFVGGQHADASAFEVGLVAVPMFQIQWGWRVAGAD